MQVVSREGGGGGRDSDCDRDGQGKAAANGHTKLAETGQERQH